MNTQIVIHALLQVLKLLLMIKTVHSPGELVTTLGILLKKSILNQHGTKAKGGRGTLSIVHS